MAIIIHEGNGSTTEQFLLAARQSKKVKLYGTTTYGVLDISNMHYVPSPCSDFQLGYSLSRSMRLPDLAIDDVGIQPDFFIHREVPVHDWIDFVLERLKWKKDICCKIRLYRWTRQEIFWFVTFI